MKTKTWLPVNLLLRLLTVSLLASCADEAVLPPPNIVWVTAEDMSPMLGSYGDENAHTPHLDAFAKRSIRYTNVFATSPVCSPARSTLITGYYAASLGTQHLRSEIDIPDAIRPYPKYLREAGYFTTNNVKEDYNFIDTTIWDLSSNKAHWRRREGDQPFFSIFNLMLTHQSSIFGDDAAYEKRVRKFLPFVKTISPDSVVLPPYYPNTPELRKQMARYYTNVGIIDYQFSQIMKELEEDGLTENTIVFFYTDHGTGVPRSKRAAFDSGLKVPLLIHIPDKYAEKFGFRPSTTTDRLVSFIDFPPTLMKLAGVEVPADLPGRPFLPETASEEPAFVYATSDRVDEGYEMTRTVRTKQYRYIRNFLPQLPLLQPNFYTDQSGIMKALNAARRSADLTPVQKALFAGERMVEELYDAEKDPHHTNNLVGDPQYRDVIMEMRNMLIDKLKDIHDLGFMPEPEMMRLSANITPFALARDKEVYPLDEIVDACGLMLEETPTLEKVMDHLNHDNGFVRYWTLITVQQRQMKDQVVFKRVRNLLNDDFPTVQVEAARTLVKFGEHQAVKTIIRHMRSPEDTQVLFATRAFEEVSSYLPALPEEARRIYNEFKAEDIRKGKERNDFHRRYAYWALATVFAPGQLTLD
ncbi:MAG: sulfatase-like hydrolase/transferase [Cyclobacteriaceae bacterium]